MSRERKTINPSTTKALIASAGGKCCFRMHGRRCGKLLAKGQRATGHLAHIIGVKGARSSTPIPFRYKGVAIEDINDFDNLLWICRDHHDEIDDPLNEDIYTVRRLIEMKLEHEHEVAYSCNFPLDERGRADAWFTHAFFTTFDIGILACIDFDDAYGDSDEDIFNFISTLSFALDSMHKHAPVFKNRSLDRAWKNFADEFLAIFPNEIIISQNPRADDVYRFLDSRDRFLEVIERRYQWVRNLLVDGAPDWL